jgi:DNA-3-methyladenine glycosylase
MYGAPGHAYVYLNYGIHCLMNVVTEPAKQPAAVLIRALAPLDGMRTMASRRTREMKGRRVAAAAYARADLCRGPGNLTMAMGITLGENTVDLLGDRLFVEDRGIEIGKIVWGPRIGIRVGGDRLWRAWIHGDPAVSARRA